MADQVAKVHVKGPELLAVGVIATDIARKARDLHGAYPTAAGLLGQAFTAGLAAASLLDESARLNLQVVCDGPARGLFVDADGLGFTRGYASNPQVSFPGCSDPFSAGGALGRSGYLSLLRESADGKLHRGVVELAHFDLPRDFERFLQSSDQADAAVALEVLEVEGEPLGHVGGALVQALPGADPAAVEKVRELLGAGKLRQALAASPNSAYGVLARLFEGLELDVLAEYPAIHRCSCSAERAHRAVVAMGREEIADMLRKDGKAVARCEFCASVYEVSGRELEEILERTAAGPVGSSN